MIPASGPRPRTPVAGSALEWGQASVRFDPAGMDNRPISGFLRLVGKCVPGLAGGLSPMLVYDYLVTVAPEWPPLCLAIGRRVLGERCLACGRMCGVAEAAGEDGVV